MSYTKAKTPIIFIGALMISSFSYIVALAWNNFFSTLATQYIAEENTIWGYFTYAIILSIILTIVAYLSVTYLPGLTS